MRLFEISQLIVHFPFLLQALLPLRRARWLDLLPLLGLLFTILHLVLEGYRWQMVPAYGLTAVLLVVALRRLARRDSSAAKVDVPSPGAKLQGHLLAITGLLTLAVAAALPLALPVPSLPPATGPFPVGTTTLYLIDAAREEIYTPEQGDARELMVQFWYPAAPTGGEAKAVLLEDLDVAGPALAREFGLPPFLLNHVNLVDLHILQDPAVAGDDQFPVLIFSHGLSGIRVQNTSLVRELASQGYVVAAIDHTFGNAITVFPDDRAVLYDACRLFSGCDSNADEANELVRVWAADMAFLLYEMDAWQKEAGHLFNGRLDLNRIGIFGHSTGGGAALQFCMQDARCTAGVGLDAWVLPVGDTVLDNPPTQPFMFVSTPSWLGERNRNRGQAIVKLLPGDSYELTLANTQHYDFTDLVLVSPLSSQMGLSGSIDSGYSLGIQTEHILAFFDRYLRMQDTLLLTQPATYPELTIAYRLK